MKPRNPRHLAPFLSLSATICFSSRRPKAQQEDVPMDALSPLSPIAPFRILRPNPHLEICYDTRTRNAVYVQHRLIAPDDNETKPTVRRPRFFEEKSLEPPYRSKDAYYIASGYDRGHLAPAADFASNSQYFADTFNLCNASPQDKDLNRKLWAQLENWSRKVAKKAGQQGAQTYVTTGPVWLPRVKVQDKVFLYNIKGIGSPPAMVMVPTHFFKMVVVVNADHTRILNYACFVVPNEASANEHRVEDFIVSWSDVEAVTGLQLFPGLADATFKTQADALARAVRPTQSSHKGPLLLTDGKQKSFGRFGRSSASFHHLCENGACAFPKNNGS